MRSAIAMLLIITAAALAITEAPLFFSEMQRADADRPRVGPAPPGTAEYNIGDHLQLWKWNLSGYPTQDLVDCTIRGKRDHGYVVVDDTVWGSQVNQTDVNQILEAWENSSDGPRPGDGIYEINTTTFGPCPDEIDGDPRVFPFYYDLDISADGFWMFYDEYPDGEYEWHSNEREIVYLNSSDNDPGGDYMIAVAAHECQHMLHWYQDSDELAWVDEGCAELAMFLYGHPDSISGFNGNSDNDLTAWNGAWADYIKTYLWTLYLYEHYGEGSADPVDLVWELVHEQANSITGVNNALDTVDAGTTFEDILPDWVAANFLDLADSDLFDGRYSYFGEDLPLFTPASIHNNYPASGSNSLSRYAGEYVLFVEPGRGPEITEWLYGTFDGHDASDFTVDVLRIDSGDESATEVARLDLDSENWSTFDAPEFPYTHDRVVLVTTRPTAAGPGTYDYHADVSETGVGDAEFSAARTGDGVLTRWSSPEARTVVLLREDGAEETTVVRLDSTEGRYLDREAPDAGCYYVLEVTDLSGRRTRLGPVEVGPAESDRAGLTLSAPYPSPSSDRVTFEFTVPGDGAARFVIYDLAGRELFSTAVTPAEGRVVWDSSAAAPGVYLARLAGDGWTVGRRLVIVR
ncbi:MAG TPA: T9SS type A sorting domain-containing protein [bacterium]|nr:T9SS type A sorting domain-containing protein [bacterium]